MTANGPKIEFCKKLVNTLDEDEIKDSNILQNESLKLILSLFT